VVLSWTDKIQNSGTYNTAVQGVGYKRWNKTR